MPITMMSSRKTLALDPENVRVVRDYLGAEAGLRHSKRCPHYTGRTDGTRDELRPECCTDWAESSDWDNKQPCRVVQPLYMHTTHRGLVLSLGELNGRDDSDFYAVVWNREKQCTERIGYATTRGWSYPNNASVDATPEALAEVSAWQERRHEAARERAREAEQAARDKKEELERERARVLRCLGAEFRIGRGKNSFVGKLFWAGLSRQGTSVRVGVKASDGAVKWCSSSVVP